METINVQQLLLTKVAEHVSHNFGLDEEYRITNFKAKDTSITLDSLNYEITVKCKGVASEQILNEVYEAEQELQNAKEEEVTE